MKKMNKKVLLLIILVVSLIFSGKTLYENFNHRFEHHRIPERHMQRRQVRRAERRDMKHQFRRAERRDMGLFSMFSEPEVVEEPVYQNEEAIEEVYNPYSDPEYNPSYIPDVSVQYREPVNAFFI